MTTHAPPVSFSSVQGDLGFSYVFAAEEIRQELAEQLNILPWLSLIGDLQGTGSDVVRVTRFGGVGFAEGMTAMAGEADPIVATGFTTGYDIATIARYGLAKSETYQGSILNRDDGVSLARLVQLVPQSFLKTVRTLALTTATGISAVEGTSGAAWSFNNELNLKNTFNETAGFLGKAVTFRHPEQFTDLLESLRNEPAYQFPEVQGQLQNLRDGGGAVDFLGFMNNASVDVPTSGGDHIGCAFAPGAIGWVTAGTSRISVENPDRAIFLEEFGMVIEQRSSGQTAQARFDANAWLGVALLDSSLYPQVRIRSIND